eukprot:Sro1443_g273170.2  (675) ;mRNA; r:14864-16888
MFKRQAFLCSNFDGFMKSLVPGVRLCITGPVAPTRNPGEALILVQDMKIQGLPHNPQHVRKLLRLVSEGLLDASDLAKATQVDATELANEIEQATRSQTPPSPKAFNGLAKRILLDLKEQHDNDEAYPCFASDHKYTTNLPLAPPDIRQPPPAFISNIQEESYSKEDHDTLRIVSESMSVQDVLLEQDGRLQNSFDAASKNSVSTTTIDMVGWVQNRRRFRDSVTVLEVVDSMVPVGAAADNIPDQNLAEDQIDALWNQRLKCVINPQVLFCQNSTRANMYGQLLAPGSQVRMVGSIVATAAHEKTGNSVPSVMWVQNVELLHSSWRPSSVQYLIEQAVAQEIKLIEAAQALKIPNEKMGSIVAMNEATTREWEAAEISRKLQQQAMDLSRQVGPEALKVIDCYAYLREQYPIHDVADNPKAALEATDFMSNRSNRWKRKKEPQLDCMSQQVVDVLQRRHSSNDTIRILDCGGGKGFLANHLARTLGNLGFDVRILVVDVAESAIKNGRRRTENQNLTDIVEYVLADASTVDVSSYIDGVDLVVALHACGALTDVALGHAINHEASFVICPCCFCSNPSLRVPHQNRRNATQESKKLLPVDEWLNIDSRRFDLLKGLAELQSDITLSNQAVHTICGMRLAAAERNTAVPMKLSLRAFPVAFSTRNFCLIGETRS